MLAKMQRALHPAQQWEHVDTRTPVHTHTHGRSVRAFGFSHTHRLPLVMTSQASRCQGARMQVANTTQRTAPQQRSCQATLPNRQQGPNHLPILVEEVSEYADRGGVNGQVLLTRETVRK